MDTFLGLLIILAAIAFFVVPIIWTMKIFEGKNRSKGLGALLGLFLGFIGVIIAYVMPVKENK